MSERTDNYLSLVALDLKTRRKISKLVLGRAPFQMSVAGPYIAVQSNKGISILGESEQVKK